MKELLQQHDTTLAWIQAQVDLQQPPASDPCWQGVSSIRTHHRPAGASILERFGSAG